MCKIWTLEDPENLNIKCITIIKTKAQSRMFSSLHSGAVRDLAICRNNHLNSITATSTVTHNSKQHPTVSVFNTLCAVVCHLFGARSLSKTCQRVHWQVLQALSPLYRNCCGRVTGSVSAVYCDDTVYQVIFWKLSSLKCRLRSVFSLLHRGLQHLIAVQPACGN